MREIPSIVKELRNAENQQKSDMGISIEKGTKHDLTHIKKNSITIEDLLDDLWFDIWRFF